MKKLNRVLGFTAFTNAFRAIERDIPLSEEKRCENDAEHSYQVAMVAWYMVSIENSNLDINKILKYSLIHDLVEVYAGDTPLYSSKDEYVQSKIKREKSAAILLKKKFPDFKDLHKLIDVYKLQDDEESRLVYAIDKLLPILSIYLDKGYAWKSHNITLDMIVDKNNKKIAISPHVKKYFDLLINMIREKPDFFIK